jgi:hypothetical protein
LPSVFVFLSFNFYFIPTSLFHGIFSSLPTTHLHDKLT